jgi:hypothetical protein
MSVLPALVGRYCNFLSWFARRENIVGQISWKNHTRSCCMSFVSICWSGWSRQRGWRFFLYRIFGGGAENCTRNHRVCSPDDRKSLVVQSTVKLPARVSCCVFDRKEWAIFVSSPLPYDPIFAGQKLGGEDISRGQYETHNWLGTNGWIGKKPLLSFIP